MKKRKYEVHHPAHGNCKVEARDENEAILKASQIFNTRWKNYSFYAYCIVTRIA